MYLVVACRLGLDSVSLDHENIDVLISVLVILLISARRRVCGSAGSTVAVLVDPFWSNSWFSVLQGGGLEIMIQVQWGGSAE